MTGLSSRALLQPPVSSLSYSLFSFRSPLPCLQDKSATEMSFKFLFLAPSCPFTVTRSPTPRLPTHDDAVAVVSACQGTSNLF